MTDKFNIFQNTIFKPSFLQNKLDEKINNIIDNNNNIIYDINLNNSIIKSYKNNDINTNIIYTFLDKQLHNINSMIDEENLTFEAIYIFILKIISKITELETKLSIPLNIYYLYFDKIISESKLIKHISTYISKYYQNQNEYPLLNDSTYISILINKLNNSTIHDNYIINDTLYNYNNISDIYILIDKIKNINNYCKYIKTHFHFSKNLYYILFDNILLIINNIYLNADIIDLLKINDVILTLINNNIVNYIKIDNKPYFFEFYKKYMRLLVNNNENTLSFEQFENIIKILFVVYNISNTYTYSVRSVLYNTISLYPNHLYKLLESTYSIRINNIDKYLVDYCYIILNNMDTDKFDKIFTKYQNQFNKLLITFPFNYDFTNDIKIMNNMMIKFNIYEYKKEHQLKIYNVLKSLHFANNVDKSIENINAIHFDYQYYESIQYINDKIHNYTINKDTLIQINSNFSKKLLSYFEYYEKINPDRKLFIIPIYAYVYVKIKYNNKIIPILLICMFILELFDDNDNININDIINKPFFLNCPHDYRLMIIESFVNTKLVNNNNNILSLNCYTENN